METPDHYFIVIESGGPNLLQHLRVAALNARKGVPPQPGQLRLTLRERKACFKQVAMGLAHLHGVGYCHLDLSSENVVARYDEHGELRVKLIDFGLARALELRDPTRPLRGGRGGGG